MPFERMEREGATYSCLFGSVFQTRVFYCGCMHARLLSSINSKIFSRPPPPLKAAKEKNTRTDVGRKKERNPPNPSYLIPLGKLQRRNSRQIDCLSQTSGCDEEDAKKKQKTMSCHWIQGPPDRAHDQVVHRSAKFCFLFFQFL